MRLVLPSAYDSQTRALLVRRAHRAVDEVSTVLASLGGPRLRVQSTEAWSGGGQISSAELAKAFPVRPGRDNPLTIAVSAISRKDTARYHAGHTRAFSPWIVLTSIVDGDPAQEEWMVRNDAYTLLHEWLHLIGAPHVDWKAGAEPSLMSPELEGKYNPTTGRFGSRSAYIEKGERLALSIDPLSRALIPLGKAIRFDGTCGYWTSPDMSGYVSKVLEQDGIIRSEDSERSFRSFLQANGRDRLRARTEVMNGLVIALFNTTSDLLEARQLSDVDICLARLKRVEEEIQVPPDAKLSACVQKSVEVVRYNADVDALNARIRDNNRRIADYNGMEAGSARRTLEKRIEEENREIARVHRSIQTLQPKVKAPSPCDREALKDRIVRTKSN